MAAMCGCVCVFNLIFYARRLFVYLFVALVFGRYLAHFGLDLVAYGIIHFVYFGVSLLALFYLCFLDIFV